MDQTLEEAEKILSDLHAEIWNKERTTHLKPGMCLRPEIHFKNPNKLRDITDSELEMVIDLVRRYNFPVTIISSFCGASFSLRIYSNHGEPARRLLTIESSQFPNNGDRTNDETVYDLMHDLAGNQSNLALIEEHKIKKPAKYSACRF